MVQLWKTNSCSVTLQLVNSCNNEVWRAAKINTYTQKDRENSYCCQSFRWATVCLHMLNRASLLVPQQTVIETGKKHGANGYTN